MTRRATVQSSRKSYNFNPANIKVLDMDEIPTIQRSSKYSVLMETFDDLKYNQGIDLVDSGVPDEKGALISAKQALYKHAQKNNYNLLGRGTKIWKIRNK